MALVAWGLDPPLNMTKILSLSYFDLPHHMRTCLLYLSVFPEDYRIDKQRLVSRCVAEGFIHEEQGRSAYEVGEGYFNDLINRSLLQPVDVEYGQPKACRVHDIILDFITCKAAEENFVTSFDSVEHGHASNYRVRRLENRNIKKVTISTSLILSHVRSLTVFGHCMQESLLIFPTLRVLDLGECWELENHHLANIEKLFHLKYLRLGQSRITELPSKIGELQYLERLDIRDTSIQELPSTIARLQRLAHLHVDHMVPNWMSLLENLRELNLYMFSMRSEDVAILGAIPSLLFLELRTFFGTDGRILVTGFRSLKYFNFEIFCCGTSLEFEAGSMPKVEHLKLELRVHKMECLNGASDIGIQHLSALTKVESSIYGDTDGLYDLSEDIVVQFVESRLETTMKKLPNHPTLSFIPGGLSPCLHYGKFIESQYNRRCGELAGFGSTEIEEEHREQVQAE
ncbi:hypothetical protein ACQ4PT_034719 [Festuca glaucescens]